MSPKKTSANDPADWLLYAEADLEGLRMLAEKRVAFLMCRSKCAEVLEKLIKAELILLGWPLVRTHDLPHLVDELKARSSAHADRLQPLAEELAEYHIVGRYPGFDFDDEEDWSALARQVEQTGAYAEAVCKAIKGKARHE